MKNEGFLLSFKKGQIYNRNFSSKPHLNVWFNVKQKLIITKLFGGYCVCEQKRRWMWGNGRHNHLPPTTAIATASALSLAPSQSAFSLHFLFFFTSLFGQIGYNDCECKDWLWSVAVIWSRPPGMKSQSFMEMIKSAKGSTHDDDLDDEDEFILKRENSTTTTHKGIFHNYTLFTFYNNL